MKKINSSEADVIYNQVFKTMTELCSTIARGMIKMATSDPHTTCLYGLRGFSDDRKHNKGSMSINSVAEFGDEDNVIDFIEYLKNKRDKELN